MDARVGARTGPSCVDRIADRADRCPGAFAAAGGVPVRHERVLSGLATDRVPARGDSLRIHGDGRADPRPPARLPASVATIHELPDGWQRVELRAEELDWVPGVLAMLDRPFVIERPDELRDLVRELAGRLVRSAAGSVEH